MKKEQTEATASAAASAPSAPSDVTFTRAVPKPGSKIAGERTTTMKFTMDGKVFRETTNLDATLDVRASDDFRITKAALDVKDLNTVKQEGDGQEKRSVSPLAGSRYVITRSDDGKLSGLDSAGNKVPAAQLKLIKDEFASVFEKDQTAAFLPDRPLKPGERLSPASDALLKMLEIKDDGKTLIDGIEFTLTSATPERASFDVALTLTQNIVAGMRLRAKLKGKIDIRPEGTWLMGVDLKGPLELLDRAGNQKGTGDLAVTAEQTYN
ncbi:MAG TPA: hypothetical protein VK524_11825 [Polyangiaceae bacterium]|nr:hypothetical protein [Polyangiaceae bacterium]